jgi:hypothetical protein
MVADDVPLLVPPRMVIPSAVGEKSLSMNRSDRYPVSPPRSAAASRRFVRSIVKVTCTGWPGRRVMTPLWGVIHGTSVTAMACTVTALLLVNETLPLPVL